MALGDGMGMGMSRKRGMRHEDEASNDTPPGEGHIPLGFVSEFK